MSVSKIFPDTNIIVYAYDRTAGRKHEVAGEILVDAWNSGNGVISTQVLQELFLTLTRKIPNPLTIPEARKIIADLLKWDVVILNGDTILEAIEIHAKHKFSFWDSMVLSAALQGGADLLYTEDLHGVTIDGLTVKDPFE